ncbi:alpha/beta hydrolase [Crocosphaera sp. XPORK-15E]|uniref:alpha/beta hydrolase n=1 Tax=Crocosphaera sp. XPORK-15E TaxID=3110247 RepID=UPI002B1F1A13|nr:alpha/beta hydrolase [Crocosphaera sp. XPORK-15E]MEA5532919.1 alpha/beta hydrolase [Crocosphaera sp. XPORK-15E]
MAFKIYLFQALRISLLLSILAILLTILPVKAAEKIYLIYGSLNLSVKVNSLEKFAREGIIDDNLEFYLNMAGVDEEQKANFRQALIKVSPVSPVQLSRFFNTEIGEEILKLFGNYVAIQGGRNGKYALRGAMVQAAFDPEGLTLINFLKKLPTNMQIDIESSLTLSEAIETVIKATDFFTEEIAILSNLEAKRSAQIYFSQLPDITKSGQFEISPKQTWSLTDKKRNRRFYVDIYRPKKLRQDKIPVIIFSHGLASRPEDFLKEANYLASYGFIVVIPQHPGSDYQQIQNLLEGYRREVFEVNEFVNRPQDISYVIDQLERRNKVDFEGKLDLKNVGVVGHSFGGYTALAIAGATIDFDNLKQECNQELSYLNTSLLLQCRALKLERKDYNFRDERVTAILAVNPVNSSIFGQKGLSKIQIPVFIGAGTYDPATPAIFEQVRSFPWFTTPHKYLVLIEGQAHLDFSNLDAGITNLIASVPNLTLPSPELLSQYNNALTLAFFETYIAKNSDFAPYLQAIYTQYLSQREPFKAYLITQKSSEALKQSILRFNGNH